MFLQCCAFHKYRALLESFGIIKAVFGQERSVGGPGGRGAGGGAHGDGGLSTLGPETKTSDEKHGAHVSQAWYKVHVACPDAGVGGGGGLQLCPLLLQLMSRRRHEMMVLSVVKPCLD